MKKLYRSQKDKKIAGICGGVSEMFSIDSTLLRLILVFIGLVTGIVPFLVTYLIGWIIIPIEPSQEKKEE